MVDQDLICFIHSIVKHVKLYKNNAFDFIVDYLGWIRGRFWSKNDNFWVNSNKTKVPRHANLWLLWWIENLIVILKKKQKYLTAGRPWKKLSASGSEQIVFEKSERWQNILAITHYNNRLTAKTLCDDYFCTQLIELEHKIEDLQRNWIEQDHLTNFSNNLSKK